MILWHVDFVEHVSSVIERGSLSHIFSNPHFWMKNQNQLAVLSKLNVKQIERTKFFSSKTLNEARKPWIIEQWLERNMSAFNSIETCRMSE